LQAPFALGSSSSALPAETKRAAGDPGPEVYRPARWPPPPRWNSPGTGHLWKRTRSGTAILADGFSCRTQIEAGHLGREGIHLAQLLAEMLPNGQDIK
jgi:hypothetical protein